MAQFVNNNLRGRRPHIDPEHGQGSIRFILKIVNPAPGDKNGRRMGYRIVPAFNHTSGFAINDTDRFIKVVNVGQLSARPDGTRRIHRLWLALTPVPRCSIRSFRHLPKAALAAPIEND